MTHTLASFFDSQTWVVVRNVLIFFLVVFWLSVGYWVYKDARRRIEDPWLVAMATLLGLVPPVSAASVSARDTDASRLEPALLSAIQAHPTRQFHVIVSRYAAHELAHDDPPVGVMAAHRIVPAGAGVQGEARVLSRQNKTRVGLRYRAVHCRHETQVRDHRLDVLFIERAEVVVRHDREQWMTVA